MINGIYFSPKVQDSATKAYVLMLVAAERLPIQDFSLRVEQSEIVEVALRVLSALQSLCIERRIGCLLETAILVDRAIRVRMWEVDYGSIFFQCQGLSDLTKKGLHERRAVTVSDLHGFSQFRVQDLFACSAHEAQQVLLFASMCNLWSLDLRVGYGRSTDDIKSSMQIDVLRPHTVSRSGPQAAQRNSFEKSGAGNQQLTELSPPHFQLICYHAQTSVLLCHRRLDFNGTDGQHSSTGEALLSFTVPLPADMFLGDVKCVLLSSVVGLDTALLPRSMAAVTPQLVASKVKKQTKGTYQPSTNAAKSKNETAVAVGSRILIQKNADRNDMLISATDGDMRTWMVRKDDKKFSNDDTETEIFQAKSSQRKSKGTSSAFKASNVANMGEVGRNANTIQTNKSDESISETDHMMDFTRSGYDNRTSIDSDYFGQFNRQIFHPTLANCIVSPSQVGNENTPEHNFVAPHQKRQREQEQQEGEVKQLNQSRISDDAFIAYGSDEYDEESSTQEYSRTYGKLPYLKDDGIKSSPSAQGVNLSEASNNNTSFSNFASYSLPAHQRTQQNITDAAVSRSFDGINKPTFYQQNLTNSTEWARPLNSGQNNYSGNKKLTNGNRYGSIVDSNSRRSENEYENHQDGDHENLKVPTRGNRNRYFSQQSEFATPSGSSGSSGRNSLGGGSAELAMLRRKNIELQLDTIPVKRMRTAASPGFLRSESALKQRVQPTDALTVDDLEPAGKLGAQFDESWSGTKDYDAEMRNGMNLDYCDHVQGEDSRNPQFPRSQDIENLNCGPPFQGRKFTSGYDHLEHDRKLHLNGQSNERNALNTFFDDEATKKKGAVWNFSSNELQLSEIDRSRRDHFGRYGHEYGLISQEGQVERQLENNAHTNYQSIQRLLPRGILSTPQQNSEQRNVYRHEVTPTQENNRLRQAPIKLLNESTLLKISAEPVQKITYPQSQNIALITDHPPNNRFGVGNSDASSNYGGEWSKNLADGPGKAVNQASSSSNYDNSQNSPKKIDMSSNTKIISSIRKAEDDDLFDNGFF